MIRLLFQMAWVSGLRMASLGVWLVGLVVLYRWFGTVEGGLGEAGAFALALAMVKVVTSCVGDAVDLQTMREVPLAMRTDPARANRMWQAAVALRLGIGLAAVAVLLLLAGWVAAVFLDDPGRVGLVRLAGLAIVAELAWRAAFSYLQAQQRFVPLVGLEAALQVLRLSLIALFLLSGAVTAEAALTGYAAASLAIVAASPLVLPAAAFRPWRVVRAELRTALSYMAWVFPALLLAAATERADLFMLAGLGGPEVAGLYGAILPIALAPDMVGAFLAAVVQPKVAEMRRQGRYRSHALAISALFVPIAALAAAAIALLRHDIVMLTVGPAYAEVADAFAILAAGALAWLALTPLSLSTVVLLYPRATLFLSVGQAAFVLAAGLPLVATLGAVGAATTIAAMRVATALVLWWLAWINAPEESTAATQPAGSGG
jgi:O-antigen/teichoic acid export membrane protein